MGSFVIDVIVTNGAFFPLVLSFLSHNKCIISARCESVCCFLFISWAVIKYPWCSPNASWPQVEPKLDIYNSVHTSVDSNRRSRRSGGAISERQGVWESKWTLQDIINICVYKAIAVLTMYTMAYLPANLLSENIWLLSLNRAVRHPRKLQVRKTVCSTCLYKCSSFKLLHFGLQYSLENSWHTLTPILSVIAHGNEGLVHGWLMEKGKEIEKRRREK